VFFRSGPKHPHDIDRNDKLFREADGPTQLAELAPDVGAEAFVLNADGAALDVFRERGAAVSERCD
jgi:hypothetical protein